MCLDSLLATVKTDKEFVKEFTQRFDNLPKEILDKFKPSDPIILDRYIIGCHGHLIYALKDKNPQNLAALKKISIEVEKNLNVLHIDMFN